MTNNKYRIRVKYYTRALYKGVPMIKYIPQKKFLWCWDDMLESYAPDGMKFRVAFDTKKEAEKYIEDEIGDITIKNEYI